MRTAQRSVPSQHAHRATRVRGANDRVELRVLNLVTTPHSATFFEQQVRGLEAHGVESTVLPVPGEPTLVDGAWTSRSVTDYLRYVPKVLRRSLGDYDLIHANYGLTAPPAVLQPWLPVVVSLWGTDLFGPFGWLSRSCARFADAVVVMTRAMAAELGQDCVVIPHGVDLELFAPRSPAAARADLGWSDEAHHVLFPYSTERAVKDHPRAQRVVTAVRRSLDRPVVLQTPVGVPHDEMPTYMNAADALLLTSKREGSPNAVKEALACDLPVVATDVGDVRERLDGVEPSFVCRSDADLVEGLEYVLRADRRSNGRDAAREVSHVRTTEALLDVYRSVLD